MTRTVTYTSSLLLLLLLVGVQGDIYLHIPRGSNNRLAETTATRTNANRVFDSQNNNRGGYNVGDATQEKAGNDEGEQYRMKYFQSGSWKTKTNDAGKSFLSVEWTNQHGCGGNEDTNPQKQNCHLVLQYMCQDDVDSPTGTDDTLRNGVETNTQNYQPPNNLDETKSQKNNRKNNNVKSERVIQEPWEWYDSCYLRQRNKGLFTADQKLKNNKFGYSSATYTRQDNQGNRYGYECPEERDYYPYWHPTPWTDIAVLAENASMCRFYEQESFNSRSYHTCVESYSDGSRKHWSKWNNQQQCVENGGQWIAFHNYLEKAPAFTSEGECTRQTAWGYSYIWAVPFDAQDVTKKECLIKLDAPDCRAADFSRSNHLGNGVDGTALKYDWTLPYFPSGNAKRCVFRIRYNISTDDYDPYTTNSSHNRNEATKTMSPVEQDPYVDVGERSALRLNINTDQTGRTFQDRSHVFLLKPRPSGMDNDRIYNLNIRGKRGNIVQVYPAVEYDFHPNTLSLRPNDLVHIQWTGSNSHNNGGNGGDGQAGDEGQGKDGTDRNNMVQIEDLNNNYPVPFEQSTMWQNAEVKWIYHGKGSVSPKDLAVSMASSGYYVCTKASSCGGMSGEAADTKTLMNKLLNNAPASYEGAVLKFKAGTYHYMCSRNNNFTNRSQKGTIIVG
ncbi:protein DD3-3-like [Mizuhopecten yessoensis]|uniref:Protein DD3-3 n=1 Tax=Mizuhopecten yessoensis TaxID=6573 RepID=A0A210QSE8_MIZYE|nr:protein DD3-3-like [Mizuhopecten yessoensis]OWF51651.1 Protein DD3-3 [Mizuhopecten yessoensis]